MNQSNIDYLFQLTSAGAARPGDNTRQAVQLPAFDDLFSLASSSTRDSTSGAPRYPEHSRPEPAYRAPGAPAAQDSSGATSQNQSSASTGPQVTGEDHRVETSGASDPADENSDHSSDVAAIDKTSDNDEHSSDHEESAELSDGADQPIANAVSAAIGDTPIVDPASAAAFNDANLPAETATGEHPTRQQADNNASHTNERAVKLIAHDLATEPEPNGDEQAKNGGEPENSAAQKSRQKNHAEGASRGVASSGAAANRDTHIAPPRAAANGLSPEAQAAAAISAAGQSGDESTASDQADDTTTSGDEPPRRASGPAATRPATRTETNVALAAVGAPTQSGDTNTAAEDGTRRPANATAAKADALAGAVSRHQTARAATHGARRPAGDDELPRVDPARFIGRVAKAFQTAEERGGTLQLRLSPPELGSLRLELTVKDGVMTAALETETASARRLLLDHLPALRDRLAEQNIRVERFDVDVRRDGGGGQADGRAAHHEQNNRQSDQPPPRREPTPPPPPAAAQVRSAPAITTTTSDTRINLVA